MLFLPTQNIRSRGGNSIPSGIPLNILNILSGSAHGLSFMVLKLLSLAFLFFIFYVLTFGKSIQFLVINCNILMTVKYRPDTSSKLESHVLSSQCLYVHLKISQILQPQLSNELMTGLIKVCFLSHSPFFLFFNMLIIFTLN